jgi:hypothetical protein
MRESMMLHFSEYNKRGSYGTYGTVVIAWIFKMCTDPWIRKIEDKKKNKDYY